MQREPTLQPLKGSVSIAFPRVDRGDLRRRPRPEFSDRLVERQVRLVRVVDGMRRLAQA